MGKERFARAIGYESVALQIGRWCRASRLTQGIARQALALKK